MPVFVAIDIGTRNFGVDVYDSDAGEHRLYLLDLLVAQDAAGRWRRVRMEERLVPDLAAQLVDAFARHIASAALVGIEAQMTRRMAVLAAVLAATIEQRYPDVTVVKLCPRSVRLHMGRALGVQLATPAGGRKRTYRESKAAAQVAVRAALGERRWAQYCAAFRRRREVRIDPGDALLMALYMRSERAALLRARARPPTLTRTPETDAAPVRLLRLRL